MASMVWCLGAGTEVAAFATGLCCGPLNARPRAVTAAWCLLMSISMLARLYGGICAVAGTISLSLLLSVSIVGSKTTGCRYKMCAFSERCTAAKTRKVTLTLSSQIDNKNDGSSCIPGAVISESQ